MKAIGAGVPGVTDPRTGNIAFCTNLGWVDVPFVQEFNKHIAKPVFVGNDATVAGLAESVAGVSAGSDSSVFITLGTGVGGGIVFNGKVWNGFHGVGSENRPNTILELDGEAVHLRQLRLRRTLLLRDRHHPHGARALRGAPGKRNCEGV